MMRVWKKEGGVQYLYTFKSFLRNKPITNTTNYIFRSLQSVKNGGRELELLNLEVLTP